MSKENLIKETIKNMLIKKRNISWTILGLAIPIVSALIFIPQLLANLGQARYGYFVLLLGIANLATSYDLGFGKALTIKISSKKSVEKIQYAFSALKTVNTLSLGVGSAILLLLCIIVGLDIPGLLQAGNVSSQEKNISLLIVSCILIPVSQASGYKALCESFSLFKDVSIVRCISSTLLFAIPCIISAFTARLEIIALGIAFSRLLYLFMLRRVCVHILPDTLGLSCLLPGKFSTTIAKDLFSSSGWIAISSLIGPLYTLFDRYLLGFLVGTTAVAYYATVYEMSMQTLIIASSAATVLLPAVTTYYHNDINLAKSVSFKYLKWVSMAMILITLLMACFLPQIIYLWLHQKFPADALLAGRLLCIGAFANSVGVMLSSFVYASRRVDIPTKFHLIEAPFYLLLLYFMIKSFGAPGAAFAWVVRASADSILLFFAVTCLYRKSTDLEPA